MIKYHTKNFDFDFDFDFEVPKNIRKLELEKEILNYRIERTIRTYLSDLNHDELTKVDKNLILKKLNTIENPTFDYEILNNYLTMVSLLN